MNNNEVRPKSLFPLSLTSKPDKHIKNYESNSLRDDKERSFSPSYKDKKNSGRNSYRDDLFSTDKHYKSSKSKNKLASCSHIDHHIRKTSESSFAKRPLSSLIRNKPILDNLIKTEKNKTFYGVLSNFYLTRKFINLLKYLTSKRTPKHLSKYHFDLMNDRSFYYEEYMNAEQAKNSDFSKKIIKISFSMKLIYLFQKLYLFLDKKIGIFDINQTFTAFWNSIVAIAMVFFFIDIPILACFSETEINKFQTFLIMRIFFLIILFIDVVKCINTSFYKKGYLIADRREIVKNYMIKQFYLDLFSLGPLLYQEIANFINLNEEINTFTRFACFLFYFKLSQFGNITKKFEEMIFINEVLHNILAFLKLIFRILLLSHIFACFWYMLGNSKYYEATWITKNALGEQEMWIKYLYSYYYVCVTMNTVGYGDITPQNPIEVLFSSVFIYVACGVFAYSLNSIGIIVNNLTKRSKALSIELNVINEFMNEKKINFELKMRVRNYLEYIFKEEKIEKEEEQSQIIKKLSESIKEELLIQAHGAVIRDVKLFSLNFSEDTLRKTVLVMREIRFTPGDIIFSQNDFLSKDLFLVRKGLVELFLENENNPNSNDITVIKQLREGDLFGEKSFFTNRERTVSARSLDFTTVYVIKQEDFLSIIKKNIKDFEKYCEIKDSINIYNDYTDLFVKCSSCNKNTHLIDQCPILHYLPATEIIIQRYTYNPLQERKFLKRNVNRHKNQCLVNLEMIEKKALTFQANNDQIYDSDEDENSEGNSCNHTSQHTSRNSTIIEHNDEDEPFMKEDEFIDEEEKNSLKNKSYLIENEENSSNKIEGINKSKIHRKSTKRKKIVLLKNSSSSKSPMEKSRTFDSSMGFDNLDNIDLKCEGTSTSSLRSVNNRVSLPSILIKLVDFLKINKNKGEKLSTPMPSENELKNDEIFERSFEIDGLKSFEGYFSTGNIEGIIEKIEGIRKTRLQKKLKKSKSIYNLLNTLESPRKEKSKFFLENPEININSPNKNKNIMRRNFFKNARNLEKLIMEDKFDAEKFKAYYIKKYEKPKRKSCFERFKNCLLIFQFFKTKTRKTIIKKNLDSGESQKMLKSRILMK